MWMTLTAYACGARISCWLTHFKYPLSNKHVPPNTLLDVYILVFCHKFPLFEILVFLYITNLPSTKVNSQKVHARGLVQMLPVMWKTEFMGRDNTRNDVKFNFSDFLYLETFKQLLQVEIFLEIHLFVCEEKLSDWKS